jgi:hypothetical protein
MGVEWTAMYDMKMDVYDEALWVFGSGTGRKR